MADVTFIIGDILPEVASFDITQTCYDADSNTGTPSNYFTNAQLAMTLQTFKDSILQTNNLPLFLTFDQTLRKFAWKAPNMADLGKWEVYFAVTATGTT